MAQLSFIENEYQKYVQLPGVNISLLKTYLRTPSHFLFEYNKWKNKQQLILEDDAQKDDRKAFIIGKALHCLTLQPDIFNKYYGFLDLSKKPSPHEDFRNPKNRDWKKDTLAEFAAVSPEKTIISSEDFIMVNAMATAIRKSKARKLLAGSTVEMPISWTDEETGVMAKATPDIANKRGFIADIKSIDDAGKASARRNIQLYKYYLQLPYYGDGLEANNYEKITGFYFIFVEKVEPFHVAIYSLDDFAVEFGRKVYRGLLATHRECEEKKIWPGYEMYGNDMGIIDIGINDAEKTYIENHPLLIKNA